MLRSPVLKTPLLLGYTYVWALFIYAGARFVVGDSVWWLAGIHTFSLYLLLPLPIVLGLSLWQRRYFLAITTVIAVCGAAYRLYPYFLPKVTPGSAVGTELNVLSYNMRANSEGLELFLREQGADIVFIQENAELFASEGIETLLELYPYQKSQDEAWGNMLLSKYPVLHSANLSGFGNSLPQRVVIDVKGQNVALYNVHLTWPIGKPRVRTGLPFELGAFTRYDDRARNTQIERLLDVTQKEALPFLVVGDFNLSATSPTYTKLKLRWQDAFLNGGNGLGHSWPSKFDSGLKVPRLLRIDYVWHSNAFLSVHAKVHPALASDQFPISARLTLKEF